MIRINKIVNFLEKTILYGLVFSIPLFFAFFLKTSNVFELNKLVLLKLAVLLLFLLTSFQLLFYTTKRKIINFVRGKETSGLFIFLILFLASSMASTFFSINSSSSFQGAYDRFAGLETTSFLVLFALLFFVSLRNKQVRIAAILKVIAASSLFVSLYAIFQHFGIDPLPWSESSQMRSFSTLGQPNHLGSFLLMTIPLAAYFLYTSKRKLAKLYYSILSLLNLLALYYSLSTSSWIALLLSGVFIIVSLLVIPGRQGRTRNLVISAVNKLRKPRYFVVLLSLLILSFTNLFSPAVKSKISNLGNFQTGSTAARLDFWQASLGAIKERPWLGHGLDTQGEVLVTHYETKWAIHSNINVSPSRAHNIFLDILLTRGLFGLSIFIAFLFFISRLTYLNLKIKENRPQTLALTFALLSYFIYLNFNYTHITNQVYSVVFIVILLASLPSQKTKPIRETEEGTLDVWGSVNGLGLISLKIVFILILLLIVSYQAKQQIEHLRADHYYLEMKQATVYNQYVIAFDMYDFIKQDLPEYSIYDRKFVAMMDNWSKRFDNDLFYEIVNSRFKKILPQIKTENFSDLFTRARIYSSLGREDEKYNELAVLEFKRLASLSPRMPALKRELGEHYIRTKENSLALTAFKEALKLVPALDSKGLNLDHKRAIIREMIENYTGIKKAYERMGGVKEVREYEERIEKLKRKQE